MFGGNDADASGDDTDWDLEEVKGLREEDEDSAWDDCLDELETFLLDNEANVGSDFIRVLCLKEGLNGLERDKIGDGLLVVNVSWVFFCYIKNKLYSYFNELWIYLWRDIIHINIKLITTFLYLPILSPC